LEAESLQVIAELRHEKVIFRVAFSPDSKMLSARGPEELAVWEVASRKRLWATNGTSGSQSDAPFSPDGHSLFCQMAGGYLGVFDATNGALAGRVALEPELASQMAMSKDGKRLAAADWLGSIFILDLARSVTKVLTNRTGAVRAVALSPDGRQLATGGFDAVITLWEVDSGNELATFRGHGKDVLSLLYAPDGERLFSGGADGTVRAWRAHPTRTPAPAVVPPGAVAAAVSRNGRFLPLYHTNTQFGSVLDLETLREGFRAQLAPSYWSNVQTWAISPDGQQVAFGKLDGSVEIWATGKLPRVLQAHSNALAALEFSPDGSRLATAAKGGEVRVWEGKGFRLLRTRALGEAGHENLIREMVFAPDGSLLVAPAGNIDILSLRPGGRDRQISGPGYVPCVDISSDGSLLAAGLGDEVRVWQLSSLRVLRRLRGGRSDFNSVCFSPDGRRLLASDALGVTWLWDISTGRDVGRFQSPGAFSLARFQTGGDTIVLQWERFGIISYQVEFLRAPTWSEIQETEEAEAAARKVWKSKKKEP
jgi:WD40 repeat protein